MVTGRLTDHPDMTIAGDWDTFLLFPHTEGK